MTWQRARQPEQKEQRRQTILEAAAELFTRNNYDAVSLNAIAGRAKMAKSNLYRYFETKEEIFLHLFLEDMTDWVDDIGGRLEALEGCGDPDVVAEAFVESVIARPRLAELMSLLSGVLEKNLSVDVAVEFKLAAHEMMARVINAMQKAMPCLNEEQVSCFLLFFNAFGAGIWPMANPSPSLKEALSRPELGHWEIDVRRDMFMALSTLLKGFMFGSPAG